MIRELKNSILIFLVMTVLTGFFYPVLITAIGQTFFRDRANGSLIYTGGKAVGSELIGQSFTDPKYFWSRLSATSPSYNAGASSGSNYGPLNDSLKNAVKARIEALKAADPSNTAPIPVDLVTASASGLDPHISLAAAYYQAPRVARLRGLPESTLKTWIQKNTQERFGGIVGEPVVNVLKLNLDLDFPGEL